ncbi:hypothetical protein EDD18DRAFT_1345691 [Armillaria luteobubalina]|uniref:DUF6533 domain-containing protein n=1 Tax=Armillaria luteobubalina TaxID=153913 RepID=A0AA39V2E4_9AGAR|nr:hypothetical protein EDD18DRAFT_1345691 [Armillaria luteobubalina]
MDPHDISHSLHDIRAVGSVLVASATLMIHEWAVLFDQEVSLMWQSPWNLVKVLYLISRYSPILDVIIALEEHIRPRVIPKTCRTYDDISIMSASVGIAIAERKVYNDYRYSYELTIVHLPSYPDFADMCPVRELQESGLWAWYGVDDLGSRESLGSYQIFQIKFEPQPSPVLPGCYLASADPIFFICFASLLLLDALQLVLQLHKAIKIFRGSRTPFISTFFRDGILYYMCLFPLALANVLVIILAPSGLLDLLDTLMRVFHSTMCCRLLLGLRQAALSTETGTMPTARPVSSLMAFRTPTAYNEQSLSTQDSDMP